MGMPGREAMFLASVLEKLGHPAPTEEQLTAAVKAAYERVKATEGMSPDETKLHFRLDPVTRDWATTAFDAKL